MSGMFKNCLLILSFVCLTCYVNCEGELPTKGISQRCKTPAIAPQKLERIIGQCQEEIKSLLLQEALDVIGIENQDGSLTTPIRNKRQTKEQTASFTNEERRVAGCLLQCVYKKVKAVDESGFPQVDGLVRLYSEGVQDRNYYLAAYTAVQQCIGIAEAVKQQQPSQKFDGGQICDLAYEMFDCVSDKIDQFCGLTPERV
uniref:Odorant-binding protein n=1 Tax=Phenacoccus solenopsis TaxID=483260 RepID=A0A0U2WRV0_9HEMI|nr:odorant-binding protein [Phenacoccus solenopsis]